MPLPEVPGVLSAAQVVATAQAIAATQHADGAIPWFPGGHTDPWDHVECAMALDAAGLHDAAARAYRWLQRMQRPDGSWASRYENGIATQHFTDANFNGYFAVGVWHRFLIRRDAAELAELWPTVQRAIDVVVGLQRPGGEIAWAFDGEAIDEALLTSSSSLYQSIRAGLAVAQELGRTQPDWELAAGRLGHALRRHPERFLDKRRWSMDWYYPVLGGAVRGAAAQARIDARWDEFYVPARGVRCVADRPWVTGAETCELALALHAIGDDRRALEVLQSMQHLRDPDGSYWTGLVFDEDVRWPVEKSTWTGAAVILAADAITGATGGANIFRGDELPLGVDPASVVCAAEDPASAVLCHTAQQP